MNAGTHEDLALARVRATAGPGTSLWLQQALGEEAGGPATTAPLAGRADLCVVGGGLVGLWTAIHAKQLEPAARVVLCEAGICGGGASGRNGGFVMTAWSKFGSLRKACGADDALHYARAVDRAVDRLGAFCDEHAIPAEFHQPGWLWAATNAEQVGAWEATVAALDAVGEQPYRLLSADEVGTLSGSPVHLAGVFEPRAATVHPGRLVRGLARVARELGVEIHERTPVTALGDGTPVRVGTARGPLAADRVVLAVSAWSAALPDLRRFLIAVARDVVATEPIPDRLQRLGLPVGMSISDSRRLVHYYRTTEDGRMVFGKGGGGLALQGRVGAGFDRDERRAEETRRQLRRTYPMLWDVTARAAWRGAVDYSLSGLPFIGALPRPGVLAGAGFSGNGVGPSLVAGEGLAEMALGRDVTSVPDGLRRLPSAGFPPEPLRCAGGRLVRAAVARKEAAEDAGQRPGWLVRAGAALDPTSFVDRGDGGAPSAAASSSASASSPYQSAATSAVESR
jgi:glycine/D-amino acid oxidase-like deaminating enzyme